MSIGAAEQEDKKTEKAASAASSSSSSSRRLADSSSLADQHDSKRARTSLRGGTGTEAGPSMMKLTPLFQRVGGATSKANKAGAATASIRWLPAFGSQSSCHVGLYGNPFPATPLDTADKMDKLRAAVFDLDGTIVTPKTGNVYPKPGDEYDYKFLYPHTLRAIQDEHHVHGRTIVIVTNQGYYKPGTGRDALFDVWKQKLGHIGRALDVPFVVLAATAEDRFRKPAIGMWDAFWSVFLNDLHKPDAIATPSTSSSESSSLPAPKKRAAGRRAKTREGAVLPSVRITDIEKTHFDAEHSFYVGDAAGRKDDHSDVDRKWASNVGIQFYTPEMFFNKAKDQPYTLNAWAPSRKEDQSIDSPLFTPTNSPLVPTDDSERDDVILFVGPPGAGKTQFYQRYLQPHGYQWVNQDTLHSADACRRAVKAHLQQGKGCVVDNTNRDKKTRAPYIALARELGKAVRCFHFDIEQRRALHNNAFRANSGGESGRSVVPTFAIQSYYRDLQVPTREEGYSEEPKTISWRFVETDEETTRRYYMYYL